MQATINKFQLDHTMKDVVPPPIVTDTPEMQATETVKVLLMLCLFLKTHNQILIWTNGCVYVSAIS